MTRFGAHVSIAGGILTSFDRIKNIGGNCMQIFSSSPRDWKNAQISDETASLFLERKSKDDIDPIYFHANYLINLAGDLSGELSKNSLIHELKLAAKLGIRGSVIHIGSFFEKELPKSFSLEKYHTLLSNIQDILDQTPKKTLFIIENSGTKKIGRTLDEIAFIIKRLPDSRVRVCLDTCHLHAAGYDLLSVSKVDAFLEMFYKKI